MTGEKLLFSATSTVDRIKYYVMNAIILLAIVYCSFHFNENPVLIIVIDFILLIVFLMSGFNQIKVFEDRVELNITGLTKFLSNNRKIYFDSISSIEADLKFEERTFALSEILPAYIATNSWNTVEFNLIDGTKKSFDLKLYKKDIIQALLLIKRYSKNKVVIKGI
jgi:hypothetical protein